MFVKDNNDGPAKLGSAQYWSTMRRRAKQGPTTWHRVNGEGPKPANIMLIGERPGEREAEVGRPFVGLAGKYLSRYLEHANLSRDQIYITNLVKTFDDYRKPGEFEINRDWPELVGEIIEVEPKIIGLLGTYAVEFVLGRERALLDRTHGIPIYMAVAGFWECMVVPMFHPAAGLYNADVMPRIMSDFKALEMINSGQLSPVNDIWKGREQYGVWREDRKRNSSAGPYIVRTDCAIDTEGSRKAPWCATISAMYGTSDLLYPGDKLDCKSRVVYLHNSLHDLSVLRSLNHTILDDQFRDTMVWAYLLGTEPQGLKDLAYRYNGMEMMSYDEVIGEADKNLALAYLEGAGACEWSPAAEYCTVEGGIAKIRKPNSINQRIRRILADVSADKRDKDGNPVDPRKRWYNIEDYLKQEVVENLGPMPEATLDDVPREKAEYYANRDSDATLRLGPQLAAKISEMGLSGISDIDHGVIPMIDRMQAVGIGLAPEKFWSDMEDECDAQMGKKVHEIRVATGWEINPDSWQQVGELLYDHLKLPITKYTDSGMASTKDKALEAIVDKHPVVDMVLEYREASKIKSSYAGPFRRLVRQGMDRVHPNMRITRVITGRLACTNPNLLAIPVRSNLGKKVRGGFIAGEGRVIADYDLDQIEMRWMADESRDETLVALFVAGNKDVHRETAARMFGVRPELVLTEQRYAAKRVGFGVITGITEHGLLDQMVLARAKRPDGNGWTLDDCKRMIKEYFIMYPGVKAYMDIAGDEVEATGMVRDRWGRLRYLPGAWSPIPAIKAEARRQASSFKIQSGAQGLIKLAMARIWQEVILQFAKSWDELWPVEPILQIYDSLMFDMEENVTWIGDYTVECMTKTVPSQTGLPFKAKGGFGKTWLSVKD